uniref:Uncharacterized protein n=2 Tax=viral metagenome TaxID=1070528 RepID=A0A6M3JHQ9_9ZZZZ
MSTRGDFMCEDYARAAANRERVSKGIYDEFWGEYGANGKGACGEWWLFGYDFPTIHTRDLQGIVETRRCNQNLGALK